LVVFKDNEGWDAVPNAAAKVDLAVMQLLAFDVSVTVPKHWE
jgi:hypothetical protein